jgi:hypothetical protein
MAAKLSIPPAIQRRAVRRLDAIANDPNSPVHSATTAARTLLARANREPDDDGRPENRPPLILLPANDRDRAIDDATRKESSLATLSPSFRCITIGSRVTRQRMRSLSLRSPRRSTPPIPRSSAIVTIQKPLSSSTTNAGARHGTRNAASAQRPPLRSRHRCQPPKSA